MHESVKSAFYPEMRLLEGETTWLYFDTHNPPLATTGLGNMIDTGEALTSFGLALPWRTRDGEYVRESQASEEYHRLKGLDIAAQGGMAYKQHARIFLDQETVVWMFVRTQNSMEVTVSRYFPGWTTLPADVQISIMSGAWNMGPRFPEKWPNLTELINESKWYSAAYSYLINNKPSERNRRNRTYLLQAALRARIAKDRPSEALYGMPTVRASEVATAAHSGAVDQSAWWTQAMLKELEFYRGSPLDGLFGPISYAALTAFCKTHDLPAGITTANLAKVFSVSSLRHIRVIT